MCGAVKINAIGNKPEVSACHCGMCRRWSSAPFMAINCPGVAFDGDEHIGKIRSSEWAERGFCTKCGSHLFYHLFDCSEYQVSAGLFHDRSMFRMVFQVFIDGKPVFHEFANETQTMTAEQIVAAFAPSPN